MVILAYFPSLNIGFWADDWILQEWVGKQTALEFIRGRLDPFNQQLEYRPLQGILYLVEYSLFHTNPFGYRLVQTLFHVGNCLLLFGLVYDLSKKWQVGFVSGLFFALQDAYSFALYYINDQITIAVFFYLLTVWCWVKHLDQDRKRYAYLAYFCFILALLSKEAVVVLPATLFLVDRLAIRKKASLKTLLLQYMPFIIILVPYLFIEYSIQSNGPRGPNYTFLDSRVLVNLFNYLGVLFSAPDIFTRLALRLDLKDGMVGASFLWTIVLVSMVGLSVWQRRKLRFLFFTLAVTVLNLLAFLGFPIGVGVPRYVYLAAIATSVFFALIFQATRETLGRWKQTTLLIPAFLATFLVVNGQSIAESSVNLTEIARQLRLPFRNVSQRHPTFDQDTFLFFVEPPTDIPQLSGMFFMRYGERVTVGGTYEDGGFYIGGRLRAQFARWRDHKVAYVYFFGENQSLVEILVNPSDSSDSIPILPTDFSVPIRLEGYEITASEVKRGESVGVLLYWRALGKIESDYTVFVHLVDPNGKIISGQDSMPRDGKERTSNWRINQLTVDGHLFTIPQDTPLGSGYRLEIGLYYLPTMEQIPLLDSYGNVVPASVIISPLTVAE